MTVQLKVTDGTTTISLLNGDDGLWLNNWRPSIVQPKGGGTWRQSALADGRRLADRRFDNAMESFTLHVRGGDPDALARHLQDLRRLLESAVLYWTTNWQDDPVWLVVQAECEKNERYAVLHNWSTSTDENPFNQPFLQAEGRALASPWVLTVERGHWLENEPGGSTCVQTSGQQTATTYTTAVFVPTQASDDAHVEWVAFFFSNNAITLYTGLNGVDLWSSSVRFRSVTIPQGAAIHSAFIRRVAAGTLGAEHVCLLRAKDTATPSDYTSFNDVVVGPHTTANITWDVGAWTAGVAYDTPDIAAIVQEVVDRGDWASGNNMAFYFWHYQGAGHRVAASWDHGEYDEPELHITWAASESVEGRAATCDAEVYVANRHNTSQLTHVEILDGAAWQGNLMGSGTPYDLLPGVPVVNDGIYFGVDTAGANTGPFASLVFDISVAQSGCTIDWEYWDGAPNWTALTVRDNTLTFQETGVNSVHFEQPSDWVVGDPGNGVTGYWVRGNVSAVNSPSPPTQAERDVYTISWPRVTIDDAQVGGDLPAIAQSYLQNYSHSEVFTEDLDTYRVIAGVRSAARGANFRAYLNLANEQNPTGLTVAVDATDGAFAADVTTATGIRVTLNTTTLNAWVDIVTLTLSTTLATDYYGEYHAFLRARQSGGDAGDIGFRLKTFYGNTEVLGDTVYFATTNPWQVLDLGIVAFPGAPVDADDVSESSGFVIQSYSTSGTPDAYLYDLIIIPIDEWAGDFSPRSEQSADSVLWTNYLDVDSLQPKRNIRALVRQDASGYVTTRWVAVANGPMVLQNNVDQDLHFFAMELPADDSSEIRSAPYQGHTVQLFCNQRYFSYRGNR